MAASACPWKRPSICRWLSALGCRQATVPARGGVTSPRPASRAQRRDPSRRPKAPGAAFSRTALRALPSALVGVQPTTVPGVPSRDAGKAAASSRCALPPRGAGVVSTSVAGTDDAGNVTSWLAGRHVLRANGQLTRQFGAVRKVATRLPRVMQAKRLTQPRNGALQGRRGCSHAGNRVSHAAHSNTCKRLCKFTGVRQVRAIYTYLTEVPETHASSELRVEDSCAGATATGVFPPRRGAPRNSTCAPGSSTSLATPVSGSPTSSRAATSRRWWRAGRRSALRSAPSR